MGGYGLLLLLSLVKPLEFLGIVFLPLYLFPMFLDGILKIPKMATDNPAGWGWGSPTLLGWVVAGVALAIVLWLVSWFIVIIWRS